jgi:hypothetical protein
MLDRVIILSHLLAEALFLLLNHLHLEALATSLGKIWKILFQHLHPLLEKVFGRICNALWK